MPVIFLTSKDEEIDEVFGLTMGADDFIRKPFSQRLLIERIRAVLRRRCRRTAPREGSGRAKRSSAAGCGWTPRATPAPGRAAGHADRHRIPDPGGARARPGVVKSRNALMDAAYDDQVYVDDRTIDSHIKRLRKKFKAATTTST